MAFSSDIQVPEGWQVKTIGDVCSRVTSGGTPSRSNDSFYQDGVWPWVKTKELLDGWLYETEELITDEAVAKSSAKVLPVNTVLLAMYGATVGQLGILGREMTCNQAACAMIVDETQAHFRYLYYLLLWQREKIKSLSTGAAQQNLSGQQIKQFSFAFPPVEEQRRIAHILGTLDDKIELNRQLNATLEQMARALFQSWFVDFDPVRAKANGEPADSICRRLGLTPELLALFPAELEDSALGEVPAGWQFEKLGNTVDVVDYVANGSFASLKENVNLLDEPDYALYVRLTDHNSDFSGAMKFVNEAAYTFLSKSSLNGYETLIANVGANSGTVFRAPDWLGYKMTLGSNAVALKYQRAYNYIFQNFSSEKGQSQLQSIITGSAQPKFNKTALRGIPFLVPAEDILNLYERMANGFTKQQKLLKAESRTLVDLRDELLQKLLSGDIRFN